MILPAPWTFCLSMRRTSKSIDQTMCCCQGYDSACWLHKKTDSMPTAQGLQAWRDRVAVYRPFLASCIKVLAAHRGDLATYQAFTPADEDFEAQRNRLLTPLVALTRKLLVPSENITAHMHT